MIASGRRVKFELEEPLDNGIRSVIHDGVFLSFGISAATDEGQYSKRSSSYSCALIEDSRGFVHSVPIDKFKFIDSE